KSVADQTEFAITCFTARRSLYGFTASLIARHRCPPQATRLDAKRLAAPESRAILRSRVGPQTCPSTLPVSVSASPDGIEAQPTDDALNLATGRSTGGIREGPNVRLQP